MDREGKKKQSATKTRNAAEKWLALRWEDLDGWAGSRSVSRGQTYQRQGRVKDLAISADGQLLATVSGGDRYVVCVELKPGKKRAALESHCTCPVGYSCKHAVAAVAEYLESLAAGKEVPAADPDDPRWNKLAGSESEADEDFDDAWEEDVSDEDGEDEEDEFAKAPKRAPAKRLARTDWDAKIRQYLDAKSQNELADLVYSLVERYSELREEFRERISLGEGDVDRLVAQAQRELRTLTSEMGWRNSWSGEGFTPDYSSVKHRFERLVELGHCDEVVKLGREFLERAMEQVGQSDDEGETAMAVAECVPVVFQAVAQSSLSGPEKLLFAIDAYLEDDCDVLDKGPELILDAPRPAADWSAVADTIRDRLAKLPKPSKDLSDFSNKYRRDHLSDWLLTALKKAGRKSEMLGVYETEARATGSYERLVDYLIAQRKTEEAERWAREGIEQTSQELPGIASSLVARLCEVAKRRKQWDVVAAHAACKFLEHPGRSTFEDLVAQSAKAKCQEQVRVAALRFLETGVSPLQKVAAKSKKEAGTIRIDPAWPLPMPDYLVPQLFSRTTSYRPAGPHYDVLLDMAIADKRPDDVLHWYDKMQAKDRSTAHGGLHGESESDRVAAAVAATHPERALEIYQKGLNSRLRQANIADYEASAGYLKKMRPVLKALGRAAEWDSLLAEIRQKYGNRPRFMEILDKLEGRTIVASHKIRGRRR